MATDASYMLEAALEQMDDIIAGSRAVVDLSLPGHTGPLRVLQLAEDLRAALELQTSAEDKDSLRKQVPSSTVLALREWLEDGMFPVNKDTYQERLVRLEDDKESLVLQVSVLADQVEAQGETIRDLENSLDKQHHKLNSTEEMLQQELLGRAALETQKLDLVDEVSYLKQKLAGMEEDQTDGEDKHQKAEVRLEQLRLLKNKVEELEEGERQYERKLRASKAEVADLQQLLAAKDAEIESLQNQFLSRGPTSSDRVEHDQEFQKLKKGLEALLAANDEKDRRIEELTFLMGAKVPFVCSRASGENFGSGSSVEELSRSFKTRGLVHEGQPELVTPEMSSRGPLTLLSSPSSVKKKPDSRSTPMSPELVVSPGDAGFWNGQWIQARVFSSSLDELQSGLLIKHVTKEPEQPALLAENWDGDRSKARTLPVKLSRPDQNGEKEINVTPVQNPADESEDSEFSLSKAKTSDGVASDLSPVSSGVDSGHQSPVSPENKAHNNSIRKFWGKIRRTQSGSLYGDDLEPSEFRRGGLRATAGPRLARTGSGGNAVRDTNTPFTQWTSEQVCDWLEESGLGQYVNLARHWVCNGQTLLSATPQDLEKEMGIKHPLHRKKLQLALLSFSSKVNDKSSELDHLWVTRWLDDIGLPQYKDQFNEGRVDGRMLQHLTVNDLLFLKVTSQLHHLSIKCAIHVLHLNKFNPNCLRRRPGSENKTSPSEAVQWSNHRVMEWLRSVDLAEYAPNLRGSGVHGGLIILEPRFNADTLAMLLNIPPQKTLLRRHLATNFSALVGPEAQQEKRKFMDSSSHGPLTTTAKVRPKKLAFSSFGNLRKKKLDDSKDYICPMNGNPRPHRDSRHLPVSKGPEQMTTTEDPVLQLGTNNLTNGAAISPEFCSSLSGARQNAGQLPITQYEQAFRLCVCYNPLRVFQQVTEGTACSPNNKGMLVMCIKETTL